MKMMVLKRSVCGVVVASISVLYGGSSGMSYNDFESRSDQAEQYTSESQNVSEQSRASQKTFLEKHLGFSMDEEKNNPSQVVSPDDAPLLISQQDGLRALKLSVLNGIMHNCELHYANPSSRLPCGFVPSEEVDDLQSGIHKGLRSVQKVTMDPLQLVDGIADIDHMDPRDLSDVLTMAVQVAQEAKDYGLRRVSTLEIDKMQELDRKMKAYDLLKECLSDADNCKVLLEKTGKPVIIGYPKRMVTYVGAAGIAAGAVVTGICYKLFSK